MLKNAYILAKIGADRSENELSFAKKLDEPAEVFRLRVAAADFREPSSTAAAARLRAALQSAKLH